MLSKLTGWILGREPVLSAEVGLAGGFAALYAVLEAFDVLHLEPAKVAAIGALVAWLAAFLARRVVTPVRSPAPPSEAGGVPLAIILLVAAFLIVGGLFASCDALFNDKKEERDLGWARVELVSHEYECDPYYDDCGGDYYEDERGSRNGRDKRTCFFGCDNIIIVPNPLDPGGGQDGSEQPRTANA